MLFFLGIIIGSIGGMIMMAMLQAGKSRESTFDKYLNSGRPDSHTDNIKTAAESRGPSKR